MPPLFRTVRPAPLHGGARRSSTCPPLPFQRRADDFYGPACPAVGQTLRRGPPTVSSVQKQPPPPVGPIVGRNRRGEGRAFGDTAAGGVPLNMSFSPSNCVTLCVSLSFLFVPLVRNGMAFSGRHLPPDPLRHLGHVGPGPAALPWWSRCWRSRHPAVTASDTGGKGTCSCPVRLAEPRRTGCAPFPHPF